MAAADVVGGLVAEIDAEMDALVDQIGDRIREDIPDFRRLPAETLARAIRGNVGRALTALRDLRPPTDAELEQAAEIGRAWASWRASAAPTSRPCSRSRRRCGCGRTR
jgi:hypothetical protein